MLDKADYYHGAAILRLVEHSCCKSIRKVDDFGYLVNESFFVALKYRTKSKPPWTFSFDADEIRKAAEMKDRFGRLVFGLICAGDGICAVSYEIFHKVLNGAVGSISVGRKHDQSYSIRGSHVDYDRKIPVCRWPLAVFEEANN